MPDPSAQRQPGHAGGRNEAARHRPAKRVRRVIHVAPHAAGLDAHGLLSGVHANTFHARQVDHQAAVAAAQASAVVPAGADRRQHVVRDAELYRRNHVGHVHAVGDQRRLLVDHAVVELARRVIVRVARLEQLAAKGGL